MNWAVGLADRIFNRLKSVADRLGRSLDRAVYKLDRFRRQLVLRFYHALRIIEKLFTAIWELVKVLFPILITFVPPIMGFIIAIAIFPRLGLPLIGLDAILLLILSALLFLLLVFSYLATEEEQGADVNVRRNQERLTYITSLNEYSLGIKFFGIGVAIVLFILLLSLLPGLFVGVVLFLSEFGVVLLLPMVYNPPRPEASPKETATSATADNKERP